MSLEDLEVHKLAKQFSNEIWEIVLLFNYFEKDTIGKQMCRSADSISANIAEGYGRFYYQEIIRFCYIARGSLEETLSHLVLCCELKYIPKAVFDSLEQDGEKLTQLINGYIGYLKRSKQGQNEPGANQAIREDLAPYDINPTEDSTIE